MNQNQKQRAMRAFAFSNVMAGLEGTIVATVIPAILADLHGIKLMSWIITTFMLLMAVTAPIWTKLSERFGTKRIFMLGTTIFVLASVLEGLSINMTMLIAARALMGLGAGAMQQIPFVIYGLQLPPDERRHATGRAIAAYSIASAIGPLIGGWLADSLGWRWVFFINVPIGAIMLVLVQKNYFENFTPNHQKIDFAGTAALSLAVISLMLGLQELGNAQINGGILTGLLLAFLVLSALFWQIERHAIDPIVPLHLFSNRSLMFKNGLMFLQYGVFGFFNNYLPIWGQGIQGVSALVGGLILIPASILLAFGTKRTNYFVHHLGERRTVTGGMLLMILAGILLYFLPQKIGLWSLLVIGGLWGLSTGLVNGTTQVAVQETVRHENIGAATALNALIRTMGTTLVLSSLALSLNHSFVRQIASAKQKVTLSQLNQIANASAANHLPAELLTTLRGMLYLGFHQLALLVTLILIGALFLNWLDPWKKLS